MAIIPPHKVSPIDENHLLYGHFIGLQYVFKAPLKAKTLEQAVIQLSGQFSALSGRYHAKSGRVVSTQQTLRLNKKQSSRSIKDVLSSPTRPQFINEPRRRDVLKGTAPLSTFTLTEFTDGGMVLGIAISHLLTDAAGFHLLIKHLSHIYAAMSAGTPIPLFPFKTQMNIFRFGTARSKADCLTALTEKDLPKPIPIKGFIGRFIKSLILKAMDKSLSDNPPIRLHFTPDDITRLKDAVLKESCTDWMSTNSALCAHFTRLMAKLSYDDEIQHEMQIGQLLDLRGRYFKTDSEEQLSFVGNAILIHIDKAEFPDGLQNTSRGALAVYFKRRKVKITPKDVKDRLDLLSDCLRCGYTNPELDVKNPIISLNNQSKMPVYDISFNGQVPARIFPQDVGDNIMFFPAPDGGIEIYIRDIVNVGGQQKLLMSDWQAQIYGF